MLHVHGGFLTNYLADLVVPAQLYVMTRGLAEREPRRTLVRRLLGGAPERVAGELFLASAATEVSQRYWPHGLFPGRFDPMDIVAYGIGLALCYVGDRMSRVG
jgi:hypothetical protein